MFVFLTMGRSRIRDHTKIKTTRRSRNISTVGFPLFRARSLDPACALASNSVLLSWTTIVKIQKEEVRRYRIFLKNLSLHSFVDNRLLIFPDSAYLTLFLFKRKDIVRMLPAIAWKLAETHTERNSFGDWPMIATGHILRRITSPCSWYYLQNLLNLASSHMSEMFGGSRKNFPAIQAELLMGPLKKPFWYYRLYEYAEAVKRTAGPWEILMDLLMGRFFVWLVRVVLIFFNKWCTTGINAHSCSSFRLCDHSVAQWCNCQDKLREEGTIGRYIWGSGWKYHFPMSLRLVRRGIYCTETADTVIDGIFTHL